MPGRHAMTRRPVRLVLSVLLVMGTLLAMERGSRASEPPLVQDPELEALRQAVRWPDPDAATILALTGRFIAAQRDQEARAYFEERARSVKSRPRFLAL